MVGPDFQGYIIYIHYPLYLGSDQTCSPIGSKNTDSILLWEHLDYKFQKITEKRNLKVRGQIFEDDIKVLYLSDENDF